MLQSFQTEPGRAWAVPAPVFRKNRQARHYILRINPEGLVTVTIPRNGTRAEAEQFLQRKRSWMEAKLHKMAQDQAEAEWSHGSRIFLRGELAALSVELLGEGVLVSLGEWRWVLPAPLLALRGFVSEKLFETARLELPLRTWDLARECQLAPAAVQVRNQRTRWGSCSRRGSISLNWRLIQAPDQVRDYVIYHELMHLKEMNHSDRFWRQVREVCPGYQEAREWLRKQARLLS
jgi:predicted metal-dependent hydrolase